jgi:hypothetical protein
VFDQFHRGVESSDADDAVPVADVAVVGDQVAEVRSSRYRECLDAAGRDDSVGRSGEPGLFGVLSGDRASGPFEQAAANTVARNSGRTCGLVGRAAGPRVDVSILIIMSTVDA